MAIPRHSHRREWDSHISDTHQFGNATAGDLTHFVEFIRLIPRFEQEFSTEWNREKKSVGLGEDGVRLIWAHYYELPLGAHILLLMTQFVDVERIKKIVEAPDQAKALIDLTNEADEPSFFERFQEMSKADVLLILGLVTSMTRNLRAMRAYGLSINELLVKGGDRDALRKAISIDPTVIACPSVNLQICLRSIESKNGAKVFLKAALKMPSKKREPYEELRIVERMLNEVGAFQASRVDLASLIIEKFKSYDGGGSAPVKGLFSRLHAYRSEATK